MKVSDLDPYRLCRSQHLGNRLLGTALAIENKARESGGTRDSSPRTSGSFSLISDMTRVRISPFYPQSNRKSERRPASTSAYWRWACVGLSGIVAYR
ncbi:MAG: hypothetical protein ACRD96_05925, partial [Bryobacteraceae bacterium]